MGDITDGDVDSAVRPVGELATEMSSPLSQSLGQTEE